MAMNKPCECTGCRDPQVATIHGMDGSYLNVCRRHADMVDAARRSEWQSAPMVDANGHASSEMYLHSRCHPRTPTWAVRKGRHMADNLPSVKLVRKCHMCGMRRQVRPDDQLCSACAGIFDLGGMVLLGPALPEMYRGLIQ